MLHSDEIPTAFSQPQAAIHRQFGTGMKLVVRAEEKLTAFVELERAIYDFALDSIS
jgi:hypothetical protein